MNKTKADEILRTREYTLILLKIGDVHLGYAVYQSTSRNRQVILEWYDSEGSVSAETLSTITDMYGCMFHKSVYLPVLEMKAFISKIEQFRKGDYDEI